MKKSEKIKLIKKSIRRNRYPIEDWRCSYYTNNNCYGYGLGAEYNENNYKIFPENEDEEYIYNLGCISGSKPARNIKEAERNFMADMKVLDILVRKSYLEERIQNGEWKVVLFYDQEDPDSYNFHFARQDVDGTWSHKEYCNGPVKRFDGNPEGCTDLQIVGYYILKVKINND